MRKKRVHVCKIIDRETEEVIYEVQRVLWAQDAVNAALKYYRDMPHREDYVIVLPSGDYANPEESHFIMADTLYKDREYYGFNLYAMRTRFVRNRNIEDFVFRKNGETMWHTLKEYDIEKF